MAILSDKDLVGILTFPCGIERLENGNTLIADAGTETGRGSTIIEVNKNGEIVWSYSHGLRFAHGVKRFSNGNTLIADTTNDRVFEVAQDGNITFSSDDWSDRTGNLSDGTHLSYPNNIHAIDDAFMVTDRNNNRLVVVDREGRVKHSYEKDIVHPHNCEPLPSGNIIIANSDENEVIEINTKGEIVWRYAENLNWPRDANRLTNGNTLIADSKNNRVIEVALDKKVVWEYAVDYFANFYETHRLDNGNTIISDQQHKQILEVNQKSEIVWKFRNFKRDMPLYERLTNGSFKKIGSDAFPENWSLTTRFSEGGGKFIWGENPYGKKVPGLEFDRQGALYLQQTVKVAPGERYTMGGSLCTEKLSGFACFQVAFIDKEDGLLCEALLSPKGESFSGDSDWTQDSFEVVVPENAVAADVRVFITGTGKVYFSDLRFFS